MIKKLYRVSRPRFWMYTVGPYLIGIGASVAFNNALSINPNIFWWLLFFTFPANIFIYGMNDISDVDTDSFNAKKGTYEEKVLDKDRKSIVVTSVFSLLIFTPLFIDSSTKEQICLFIFLIFGLIYSLPPLRLKSIPFIDSLSNGVLYTMPGLMGFYASGGNQLSLFAYLGAFIWASVMHAYSAIPDIEADSKAGIKTIATVLGAKKTLFLCFAMYLTIGALMFLAGIPILAFLILPYLLLIWTSIKLQKNTNNIFIIYKVYPYITYIVGPLVYIFIVNFK